MAPKKNAARDITPSAATTPSTAQASVSSTSTPLAAGVAASPAKHASGGKAYSSTSSGGAQSWDKVIGNLVNYYMDSTPQRTKLLDAFMAFLAVVGALQFLYCILAGNYPFNAFLSGFSATVGQFVLTASLRIQTTEANKSDFPAVSPERAFADYVVCSLILHFFCVNFIN
ncbi:defender against death DAD protein [Diplogelasinospora grovesii]|uniref:Dolichyl-diphosphooligosaccharide--protein glycosyltransferase subunit OST2 n=1 Tax=Diplogelasinospora grovesii TaxID=303347 RepID=A0AAN6S0V3_9PEZI|nr:defender against death DAD protein [Diplogelasinospora grovesii]